MPPARTTRTEAGRAVVLARRRRVLIAVGIIAGTALIADAAVFLIDTFDFRAATPAPQTMATVEATISLEPTPTVVAPKPSGPATITVAAVGDMHFDRQVKKLISMSGGAAPLKDVAARLASADIAFGNLESPLSSRGVRQTDKEYTFQGDPRAIEGLALAGFDFLSLANNHTLDCGNDALADTITLLDERGIGRSGAGMNKGEAFILEAELGPSGVTNARMVPVYLDAYGKPEYVTGTEATVILERLKAISIKRNTTIEVHGDTAEALQ